MCSDTVIIGVHGLLNKNNKEAIGQWWKEAISEGLRKNCHYNDEFNFKMIYWADLLHKYPLHSDNEYYFDELYDNEPYFESERTRFKRYSYSVFNRIKLIRQNIQRGMVNLLQTNESISLWAVNKFFRDMAYYYNDQLEISNRQHEKKSLREILMQELIDELKKYKGERIIVIGHSMGAVISYDVLRNLRSFVEDIDVYGFCTIGAPLAYAMTYRHPLATLTDGHFRKKLRTPTVVKHWYNFADPRDLACYRLKLSSLYAPNRYGVRVVDRLVHNQYENYNKSLDKLIANPHKSFGYLRTPEFSEVIKHWLISKT